MSVIEHPKTYNPAFDGLRAVSIAMVFLFHSTGSWARSFPVFGGGFVGVDIFFVLSGFLITRILIHEWSNPGLPDLRAFLLRRLLRLFPALFVLLVMTSLMIVLSGAPAKMSRDTLWDALFALLYLANWRLIYDWNSVRIFDHCWSLAIEEQFYVIWSVFLLYFINRWRSHHIITALAVVILLISAYRIVLFELFDMGFYRIYMGTDTRFDALLWGCLGAYARYRTQWSAVLDRLGRNGLLPASCLALLVIIANWATIGDPDYMKFLSPVVSFLSMIVIWDIASCRGLLFRVLSDRTLVFVGTLSYSIYLWHVPVLEVHVLFSRAIPQNDFVHFALGVVGTMIMATASRFLVERPFLRLKSRVG